MRHALDAGAVVEYLEAGEPARSRVDRVLARERPVMSWINLGEVAYLLERRVGRLRAREWVAQMRGSLTLDLPTEERVLNAASIKAAHSVSYADAFALATAQAHDAVLLTGDPEILAAGVGRVEDLRAKR